MRISDGSRGNVLASERKPFFFNLADCIVYRNPTVRAFFALLDRKKHR